MDSKLKQKVYLFGLYEIIGGLVGIFLTLYLIQTILEFSILLISFLIVALFLYSYSIFCGIMLFSKKLVSFKYSRVNQYLQLFGFFIVGYGFRYVSGFFVTIGLDFTEGFSLNFNAGISTWQINWDQTSNSIVFSFNFIALLLVLFLDKQIRQQNDNKIVKEISKIGNVDF